MKMVIFHSYVSLPEGKHKGPYTILTQLYIDITNIITYGTNTT